MRTISKSLAPNNIACARTALVSFMTYHFFPFIYTFISFVTTRDMVKKSCNVFDGHGCLHIRASYREKKSPIIYEEIILPRCS